MLENPDSISRNVLDKGLNQGTAFEILSIDIADIDVGKNIGAQLQADQAGSLLPLPWSPKSQGPEPSSLSHLSPNGQTSGAKPLPH